MKTRVRFIVDDRQHHEYRKDEFGYIDGYLRGADDVPYAAVVVGNSIVLASLHSFVVVPDQV